MMLVRAKWFAVAAVLWSLSGPGTGTSKADDVQVNSYTTGNQDFPSVAMDADGDFVVVWTSYGSSGTDSAFFSVQGQRYASNGAAAGGEFQINTYTTGNQVLPSVALDADGDFVVVWQSFGSATDPSFYSIQGQRYAADGSTVGGQFQVNTYTTSTQANPSVAIDAAGDFVVVWRSIGSSATDSSSSSVQGQRYASDGSTVGSEFQVNTYITGSQGDPSVAIDADGDFVVVWTSYGSSGTDSSGYSVQSQRFASDGSTVGGELQVNTYTTNRQDTPTVAMDADGDFVIAWEGNAATDPFYSSILSQRFASDGSTVGGEFQVDTYTTGFQYSPSVALDADGDFIVVWRSPTSSGTDSSISSVQGQRYASDGSSVGGEFQVNTYTTNFQGRPSVAVDADGDFVVVWLSLGSSGTDTSGYSIQARVPPVLCAGLPATIVGTAGDDPALLGTAGDDVIHGLGGDDVIDGGDGDDVICGGLGNDDLTGGDGDDILLDEGGDDIMAGGPGQDMLMGGSGVDTLNGDDGDDFLNGGVDDDVLRGGRDDDMLLGSWGDDMLEGGPGIDFLNGNGGDDVLNGGADDDRLLGRRGNDTLSGSLGNDLLEGGPGNDELSGNGGHDRLLGGDGDDLLKGGTDHDNLTGDAGVDVLKGGPGSDVCDGETEIGCEVSRSGMSRKPRRRSHE